MNESEVMELLEANHNERGIKHWASGKVKTGNLKSFGIGLTVLRKLGKKIGRNHALSQQLWQSDFYDAKVIALVIDDPKKITLEQAERQVEQLEQGMLCHVFSSCDAALAKTPFVVELSRDWINSDDPTRRRCGYGLLYEISKSKKKSAPDEAFFLERIEQIRETYAREDRHVLLAMGGALMGIGKRTATLNAAALEVAQSIGPIHFADDDSNCDPFDVVKHLTSDYLKEKLGI